MSHIVKQSSKTKITDLSLLEAAVKKLGGKLVCGQKTATFYGGQKAACDHAIAFPGTSYEIGLTKAADGSYDINADLCDMNLRKLVSTDLTGSYGSAKTDKIFERYLVEKTHRIARQKGNRIVGENRLANGKIELIYQVL
jgi:hypothetical protein